MQVSPRSQTIFHPPLIFSNPTGTNSTSEIALTTLQQNQISTSPSPLASKYDQIAPEYTALIQLLEPAKKDLLKELKTNFRMFFNLKREGSFEDMVRFLIPKCYSDFRKLKPESYLIGHTKEDKELFYLTIEHIYTHLMNAFFLSNLDPSKTSNLDQKKFFNDNIIQARKVIKQLYDIFKNSNHLKVCDSLRNLSHITDILIFLRENPEGKRLSAMKLKDIWKNPSPRMGFSSKELGTAEQTAFDVFLFNFDPARVSRLVPSYGENEKERKSYLSLCQNIHKLLKTSQNQKESDCSIPVKIAGMIYNAPSKTDPSSILSKHSEFMDYLEHLRLLNSTSQMRVIQKKINLREISDEDIRRNTKFIKDLLPLLLEFTHNDLPILNPESFEELKIIQEIQATFVQPIKDELEKFNQAMSGESCNNIVKTANLLIQESDKNSCYYSYLVVKLFTDSIVAFHSNLSDINTVITTKKEQLRQSLPFLFENNEEFQNIATWIQTIESILYIHLQLSSQILDDLIEFTGYFYQSPKEKLPKKIKKMEDKPLQENIPPHTIQFSYQQPKDEPQTPTKVKIKTRPEKPLQEITLVESAQNDNEEVDYTGLHPNLAQLLKGNLKYRKFVQLLQSYGCTKTGQGKHAVFETAVGNKVPVPVHPGTDLKFGTALSILEKAVKDSNS